MRTRSILGPEGRHALEIRRWFTSPRRIKSIAASIAGTSVQSYQLDTTPVSRVCSFSVQGVQFGVDLAQGHIERFAITQETNGPSEALDVVRQGFESAGRISSVGLLVAVGTVALVVAVFSWVVRNDA